MINDAFGNNWDKVKQIKSENWYFNKMENERGINDPEPLPSAKLKPLHYGEGYCVYLSEAIPNFQWHIDESQKSDNFVKKEPDNFSYTKKADYEAIDVVDIPADVSEIGVFENGVCVGGVKVDENSEQILVYSDSINRDESEFSFEVITGRGNKKLISNYQVFNLSNKEFQAGKIIARHQNYSIVKLGKSITNSSDIDKITTTNYPNPFGISESRNLGTTISYEISKDANVSVEIYNIKGQKVKTLLSNFQKRGKHFVVWNGKDENNKNISSGVYFYKINTGNNSTIKKILLLK